MSDDEIVREFLVESYENLDRLDRELVTLEKDPGNPETLASIFRTVHTIKGTSGFLTFNQLEAVTHVGESLLAKLRDGLLTLSPEITTALLQMVDAVRQMLGSIETAGNEGERHDQQLIAALTQLLYGKAEFAAAAAPLDEAAVSEPCATVLPPDVTFPAEKPQEAAETSSTPQPATNQSVGASTIRVEVSQLDRLMNQMGELVLLRNQLVQHTNSPEDSDLLGTAQRLNLLTTELQEGVMKTRMQPIGNIWGKFPRTVRDVALNCGKQVRIEMEGKETELDKTIIEAIKDPLTHLVRNAVDHGIETPEARLATGKDPEGLLFLRAFHEGGQVNIEVTDDGSGLDLGKIRDKAIQKSLITSDQAVRMSEREVANLIWMPGFSTAEKVTNVSGRGVGMDVVKTNIEKIGGTVDVQSKLGQGLTVRMKIPLTLAIIPALIVTTAGDRYAIPQVSLLELVRLEGEQARHSIESVNGAPVYRLRGRLLPLVYLNQELQGQGVSKPASETDRTKQREAQSINIVVLRADGRPFGMVVDEINDTEEIVVKPLSKQLKIINIYSGATIMGDGRVALILDVLGLAQRANVIGEIRDQSISEVEEQESAATGTEHRDAVLLFQCGDEGRMAIDLALVARLEEFSRDTIEIGADQEVVQYRGQIMPLIRVSQILAGGHGKPVEDVHKTLHVVVYSDRGRSVGLVVDRILDIVEESFVLRPQVGRRGVLGSAVIQKCVTDLLDVRGLIEAAGNSQSMVTHA